MYIGLWVLEKMPLKEYLVKTTPFFELFLAKLVALSCGSRFHQGAIDVMAFS